VTGSGGRAEDMTRRRDFLSLYFLCHRAGVMLEAGSEEQLSAKEQQRLRLGRIRRRHRQPLPR